MIIENRPLDWLKPGDRAEVKRLCTADDLYVFAAATGNHNPMHLPDADVDGDGRPEAIASGIFLAAMISAVLGNRLPGPGTLYRSQSLEFLGHARAGDELLAEVEVVAVASDGAVTLSTRVRRLPSGEIVVQGQAVVQAPLGPIRFDDGDLPGLIVERHRHFKALIDRARGLPPLTCAVVWPQDRVALEGALAARAQGILEPRLVGQPDQIAHLAESLGQSLQGLGLVPARDEAEAAALAVAEVRAGRAQAIMKGHLHTDTLMAPILAGEQGLRRARRMSHVFVLDIPGRARPLMITDAAVNIAPDLAAKADIIRNAIDLAQALGIATPRVGVLSSVEVVNPAIPSSIDAALLAKMAERGQITGGLVDGPLAMDNALDLGAARAKGIHSRVAGRADVLVVPDLDAGNMLVKLLTHLAHAEAAGLVLGAAVPIVLTSRADGAMERLASAAVARLYAAWVAARGGEGG